MTPDPSLQRVVALTYTSKGKSKSMLDRDGFDLMRVYSNVVLEIEYTSHDTAQGDFKFVKWVLSMGSGDRGDNLCDNVGLHRVSDEGRLADVELKCHGTPATTVPDGDRSGYQRIKLQYKAGDRVLLTSAFFARGILGGAHCYSFSTWPPPTIPLGGLPLASSC
jgi:hypothetical protein